MLEVGQPGELPLMRDLTALKKTKVFRDPSTITSSWKSPVLQAVSSTTTELNLPSQDRHEEMATMKEYGFGGSGRSNCIRGTIPSREGSLRSPQLGDIDPRISWDRGREAFVGMDAGPADFHQQREDLKTHLEKLGVLGDSRELGKYMVGGKSLLHNWRPVVTADGDDDVGDDDVGDGEVEGSLVAESFEQEASPDMRNWPRTSRDGTGTHHGFLAHQEVGLGRDDFTRVKASQKTSRMPRVDRFSGPSAQILSPLVLNSHDDLHKFSQPKSFFTLEEPYDEEEQYLDIEEAESRQASVHNKVGLKSHSPLGPPLSRRSSRKQTMNTNPRPSQMIPDTNFQVSQSSLSPELCEAEFLEYEVDSLELPCKKDSGILHHRSKSQKPPKFHSVGQGEILLTDPRKTMRRKGGSAFERQSKLQQQFTSASYPSWSPSPEPEPLPFLTELEDYNDTEGLAASSVDGDGGLLSMNELHGELELEVYNVSSEGHHAGKMVKMADKESLQLSVPECKELALCDYKPRNLSQKYRPKVFQEVVGQNIVTQALSNAILRGKIAPVYLFQGSRGTGKTSAARIFAASLICISREEQRPCGTCRECTAVATGKCSEVKEVDAASNNGIEKVKALLEETISAPSLSQYKVFIIDECHVLTTETWNALLKILEEPPMNVVFILITTDPDRLPRTVMSRCQKFPFPKIKEFEIVKRLQQLAGLENIGIDTDTLQLIASRSDGSLRDAETTLDQLSLLGEQISSSTVYELVGSASDECMLSLLDSALLADTVGTVRRARELVDSGVEPLSLMSRLATLITDILAGSYKFTDKQRKGFFRKQNLSEDKLERLRMAMKTLSEAEKQLRVSNDRTTWLTAALLQLGPARSCLFPASCAGTSVTQSPVVLDDVGENEAADFERRSSGQQTLGDDANHCQNTNSEFMPSNSEVVGIGGTSCHMPGNQGSTWSMNKINEMPFMKVKKEILLNKSMQSQASPGLPRVPEKQQYGEDPSDDLLEDTNSGQMLTTTKLDDIWCRVVERCRPLPLRQLLHAHGKLVSISMSEVDAVIHLEVSHPENKSRCERSQKRIANMFESVLGFPVEVKISLASLPAEEKLGTQNWMPTEQYRLAQDSTQSGTGNSNRVTSETMPTKGYFLNHWKHAGSAMNRMGAYQSNSPECFPAIPQTSFGSPLKENQLLDPEASTWNSKNVLSADSQGWPAHPAKSTMGDHLQNARIHEKRTYSPLTSSISGNITSDGARNQCFEDMNMNGYMQGLEDDDMDGVCSDGERDIDEILSCEPREATTLYCDEARPRYNGIKGQLDEQSYSVDGRRSCDTDLQKRKGSSLKMVRRLTMRSRIQSLPSSDPNSPDGRGSSWFAMKGYTNSQKNKEFNTNSGDGADISEQAGDSAEAGIKAAAAQKRSKLKGAAGSFARFFKGSK